MNEMSYPEVDESVAEPGRALRGATETKNVHPLVVEFRVKDLVRSLAHDGEAAGSCLQL